MGTFSSGGSTMGEYKPVEQNFVIPTSNSTYIGVKSNYSYYDIETLDVGDLTLSDEHNKLYRELESLSYDEESDSFTLYFNNPFHNATAPHVIARGVKIDSAQEVDHNMPASGINPRNNAV